MPKDEKSILKSRPPIVVVMGHVDHGKTTLLDYIRKTNVAGREAGGITQSVGAYEIEIPRDTRDDPAASSRRITFIDTPGHEAFVMMRTTGTRIADLAILVVAADESVKPQTKEAIKILQNTNTPFVVAFNKIDRPSANIEKTMNDLGESGVLLEGRGGQISHHGISAKTGEGVDALLDLVRLTAEVEEFKYNPLQPASGYILEVRRDDRRGTEAICIIKDGVLRETTWIATPSSCGRVKILEDFLGRRTQELAASAPAIVVGFENIPSVGEPFATGATLEAAKETLGGMVRFHAETSQNVTPQPTASHEGTRQNLILRADDLGSLAALSHTMHELAVTHNVKIFNENVGNITDGDIKMAVASRAVVIGFKSKATPAAKKLAEGQHVTIITSPIIYDLVKAIEDFLLGSQEETLHHELEILAVFSQAKLHEQLVGGKIVKGVFRKNIAFSIIRGEETVGKGKILSIRIKKDTVEDAKEGVECGLLVNADAMIQIADRLVAGK